VAQFWISFSTVFVYEYKLDDSRNRGTIFLGLNIIKGLKSSSLGNLMKPMEGTWRLGVEWLWGEIPELGNNCKQLV
jgi:hypothetical protein